MDGFFRRDGVDYACRLHGDNGMNELFRTFNPHEETAQAAREWNQRPSDADRFRVGILNANVNDRPFFQEVQENAALGARLYDNMPQRTSITNPWNSPYWRDAMTAAARDHGTAAQKAYLANEVPWGDFYEQHAGQNVPPWMGVFPRMSRVDETVGFDLNLEDPLGLGGEALIDYNVSPSMNIRDMRPLRGEVPRDITLKYVKRF